MLSAQKLLCEVALTHIPCVWAKTRPGFPVCYSISGHLDTAPVCSVQMFAAQSSVLRTDSLALINGRMSAYGETPFVRASWATVEVISDSIDITHPVMSEFVRKRQYTVRACR